MGIAVESAPVACIEVLELGALESTIHDAQIPMFPKAWPSRHLMPHCKDEVHHLLCSSPCNHSVIKMRPVEDSSTMMGAMTAFNL